MLVKILNFVDENKITIIKHRKKETYAASITKIKVV